MTVDHPTILRGVQRSAPELEKRCRPQRKAPQASSRVDATDLTRNKPGQYLYRAVDSTGATVACMWSVTRNADTAEQLCRKVLDVSPPPACDVLPHAGILPERCQLRPCTYVHDVIEQDHRLVTHRVHPGWGVGACATAQQTIQGDEALHMLRNGQRAGVPKREVLAQNRGINRLVGLAA